MKMSQKPTEVYLAPVKGRRFSAKIDDYRDIYDNQLGSRILVKIRTKN